ncbi:unnamed protein product, partial [Discosporangium mesarthrocarpum]
PQPPLCQAIAIVEKRPSARAPSVLYVPAMELPFQPRERLAALFRIRPRWPMGELEPYIS